MKNDPMPDGLENFADVEFVVDMAATDENAGKLDTVQQDSGVTLYDNGQRLNGVVDIARGVSSQTFEEYMADLNAKWAGAIQ
jgi:hypothetical protein